MQYGTRDTRIFEQAFVRRSERSKHYTRLCDARSRARNDGPKSVSEFRVYRRRMVHRCPSSIFRCRVTETFVKSVNAPSASARHALARNVRTAVFKQPQETSQNVIFQFCHRVFRTVGQPCVFQNGPTWSGRPIK